MGLVKSVVHAYSWQQYLCWYIDKHDIPRIRELLGKNPTLLKQALTLESKTTALNRATYNGSLELVKMFIEEYQVNVNFSIENGQTALMIAAKRNHLHIINYLLGKGANADQQTHFGLLTIDFAILPGLYEAAFIIYLKMKNKKSLKSPKQYSLLGKQHFYRYVNYQIFINMLQETVVPQLVKDYLTKKKIHYNDPVIDPRQTWKNWFKRNLYFQDPPLVERDSLPQNLRPENQNFSKVKHFFTRLTLSPMTPMPSLKPQTQTQTDFQGGNKMKNNSAEINTIS